MPPSGLIFCVAVGLKKPKGQSCYVWRCCKNLHHLLEKQFIVDADVAIKAYNHSAFGFAHSPIPADGRTAIALVLKNNRTREMLLYGFGSSVIGIVIYNNDFSFNAMLAIEARKELHDGFLAVVCWYNDTNH